MPAVTNILPKDYEAVQELGMCARRLAAKCISAYSQELLVYDGYRWTLHKVPGEPYCPFGVYERGP